MNFTECTFSIVPFTVYISLPMLLKKIFVHLFVTDLLVFVWESRGQKRVY